MNTIDKLLKSFVGKDSTRPSLLKAVRVGDKIYATDAHSLIVVPKDMTETEYPEDPRFPNCEAVITQTPLLSQPIVIDYLNLKDVINSLPLHNVYEECSQCEGEGTIECQFCSHYSDCEDCKGTGETSNIIGKEFNNYEHRIKISEGLFNPNFIKRVIDACEMEKSEIRVLSNSPNRAMILEIGRINILVMPQMQDPEADYTIHEIKIIGSEREQVNP